jgi:hypothetical protein
MQSIDFDSSKVSYLPEHIILRKGSLVMSIDFISIYKRKRRIGRTKFYAKTNMTTKKNIFGCINILRPNIGRVEECKLLEEILSFQILIYEETPNILRKTLTFLRENGISSHRELIDDVMKLHMENQIREKEILECLVNFPIGPDVDKIISSFIFF